VAGQPVVADVAESVAGVVRLLRRAAELVWAAVDGQDPRSPRQLLALGIEVAAGEARNLLSESVVVDGPVPVVEDPAGLLRSAEQLWGLLCGAGAPTEVHGLRVRVAELV
jgi:hypothetical protein